MNKTKAEAIFELVLSLNAGNAGFTECRVPNAIKQYEQLVAAGVINKKENDDKSVIKG